MRKTLILLCTGLAACGAQFPVTGELEQTPAQGTVTVRVPEGSFSVTTVDGLICGGTYDAMSSDITITAPVRCADGRRGTAIITRKTNLLSGTVLVRLNDGATGRFVFGDLSFGDEFG